MLVNEKDVVLETGVEVRLESKLDDDGIVVAVDVRIDTVKSLEDLLHQRGKLSGEGYT